MKRLKAALNLLAGRRTWPITSRVVSSNFEEQVFERIVEPGGTVFDVGANLGTTATFFARLVGVDGQVVAFEPVPSTYLRMCFEIQRDCFEKSVVCPLPYGLADTPGYRTIGVPARKSALASLALQEQDGDSVRRETVLFSTLDHIVAAGSFRVPTMLKIDVEGAELLVLKGASKLLREIRPVIHLEVFAPWLRRLGQSPWDVLGYLQEYGYSFWFACPNGVVEHRPTADRPYPEGFDGGYNVVSLQPGRHQQIVQRLSDLKSGSRGLLHLSPPPMPNA